MPRLPTDRTPSVIAAYHLVVGALEPNIENELVVAEDGSIPADQLASLGSRLRQPR